MINLSAEGEYELKRSIEKLVDKRTRRHGRSRGAQRRKLTTCGYRGEDRESRRRELWMYLMCVERSARIDGRTHKKYIEVKAHLTHTCPQFPVPAKEQTPTDYLTSQETATKIPVRPQNAQISTFVQFSSIASSYHPTLSTSSSHTSFYQRLLLLLQLLSHLSLSLFSHPNPFSHPTTPKMEPPIVPNAGVPGQSKYKYTFLYHIQKLTDSIYLVIGAMLL